MLKIIRTEKSIKILSPYVPSLPDAANKLGGKYNDQDRSWTFDIRDEKRVKNLYTDIYGEWDDPVSDLVNVRITVNKDWRAQRSGIFLFGRLIARAYGRDSGAKLGDGVILLEGKINSMGSMKYWETVVKKDSILELKDIPKKLYDSTNVPSEIEVEIIKESIDKNALLIEKEKLLKRLAEIDELLGAN